MAELEDETIRLTRGSTVAKRLWVAIASLEEENVFQELVENDLSLVGDQDKLRHRLFQFRLRDTSKRYLVPWDPKADKNKPTRYRKRLGPKTTSTGDSSRGGSSQEEEKRAARNRRRDRAFMEATRGEFSGATSSDFSSGWESKKTPRVVHIPPRSRPIAREQASTSIEYHEQSRVTATPVETVTTTVTTSTSTTTTTTMTTATSTATASFSGTYAVQAVACDGPGEPAIS